MKIERYQLIDEDQQTRGVYVSNRNEYNQMIDECYEHESKLTDGEGKFLDDISNQLAESPTLSEAQEQELERIHERVNP